MSKDTTIKEDLDKLKKTKRQTAIKSNPAIQAFKGLWMFLEGTALVITSLYAIYQGRYGTLPNWGAYILIIAGVLVLVPAGILLSGFFRRVGKEA